MISRVQTRRWLAAAILAGAVGFGGAAKAVTISVNFDAPGQLANFNAFTQVSTPASTGGFIESTSGGVSNTGSIALPQATTTDETITYAPQAFDFSQVGQTITESAIFRMNPTLTNTASGAKPIQLGFLSLPNAGFNGNANQVGTAFPAFTSLRFNISAAGSAVANFQGQDKIVGVAATGASTFSAASGGANQTLIGNEYYSLSLTATQNGGGSYTISGSLQDMGTDGATVTGAAQPFGATTRTGIADLATTVYAAVREGNIGGASNFDSFTVTGTAAPTPEPASLSLLALGSVGLLTRRRRA